MTSSADKVLQVLEEVHALEAQLLTTLTAHIGMTPRGPYRDLLERHRYETRTQVQRLEQRLSQLGASRSLVHVAFGVATTVVGQATALALGPLALLRGTGAEDKLLRNAKEEAASEALEIANYDALEAIADAVGDEKTAVLAREHRTQEEIFLADLRAAIPGLAEAMVEAEVEGHPRFDPRTTGAADAARAVGRKAKGTAAKARDEVVGTAEEVRDEAQATARKAKGTVETAASQVEGEARGAAAAAGEQPVSGYDELTVDQLLPKLKTLSAEDLAVVDGYERGGRNRKRVLDRVAALRERKVAEELEAISS